MREFNDNFNQFARIQPDKEIRVVIELSFDLANSDLLYLTSHANTPVPGTATQVTQNIISRLRGTSQRLNPIEGRSTIGAMSFSCIDLEKQVTSDIKGKLDGGNGLRDKRVRFYIGYAGLAWNDFELISTQRVKKIQNAGPRYDFSCNDIQREQRKEIFAIAQTNITQTLSATATVVDVASTDKFERVEHGDSYSDGPGLTVGYLFVEDTKEIIRWESKAAGQFLQLTRGVFNTRAARVEVDVTKPIERRPKITEFVYLEMPAPKLAYAIMTGVLHNNPTAATLPETWHLGMDPAVVRLTDYTGIGLDWWDLADETAGVVARFAGETKSDGKIFLEKQIFRMIGAYAPVYAEGDLGLKRMTGVISDAAQVIDILYDDVTSHGSMTHDMDNVHNTFQVDWNWDEIDEETTRTHLIIDAVSAQFHGESDPLNMEFRGLHGSRHTNETIENLIQSLRDRYAGPPLLLDVVCRPHMNMLEVGDIVRVQLDSVRDYSNDLILLDRSFEVQEVRVDWVRGNVRLKLFGSSQQAGALTPVGTGTVLPDEYYVSEGNNLATYVDSPYYDFNLHYQLIGQVGHIAADCELRGGDDLNNVAYIYYHDGDLTVDAGVTMKISNNVQLRVKGTLTVNGKIDGKGLGYAGAIAPNVNVGWTTTRYLNTFTKGTPGYLGNTVSGGGIQYNPNAHCYSYQGFTTFGLNNTVPFIQLSIVNGVLTGIPADMRGTSGSSGRASETVGQGQRAGQFFPAGAGNGGGGGAALWLTNRGVAFGVNGEIDMGGGDAPSGNYVKNGPGPTIPTLGVGAFGFPDTNYEDNNNSFGDTWGGLGGGGAPGALFFAMDGSGAITPDLTFVKSRMGRMDYPCTAAGTTITAFCTNSVPKVSMNQQDLVNYSFTRPGVAMVNGFYSVNYAIFPGFQLYSFYNGTTASGKLMNFSASRIQYLQPEVDPEQDNKAMPDVQTFTARNSGDVMIFQWSAVIHKKLSGYILRYGTPGIDWANASPITQEAKGTRITDASIPTGTWDFLIKAVDIDGNESAEPAIANFTVTSSGFREVLSQKGAPLWPGTLTNLVKHWTGCLLPADQNLASFYTNFEIFDQFVPTPYPTCDYEAPELDSLYDDRIRISASVEYTLGPGETTTNLGIEAQADWRLDAGAYDGFQEWSIGEVDARYAKFRAFMDTSIGKYVIHDLSSTLEALERSEKRVNQVVSPTGLAVTFDQPFRNPPFVKVFTSGSTAVFPTRDSITGTGFVIHVFDTNNVEVGGLVDWEATGI